MDCQCTQSLRFAYSATLIAFFLYFLGLGSVDAASSANNIKPEDIPIKAFATLPNFSEAKLSRSGTSLAYFVEFEGHKNLVFHKLDGSESGRIPPNEGTEITYFTWANDEIILFQLGFLHESWSFRRDVYKTRTLAFNTKTHESIWLGEPEKHQNQRPSQIERIVDMLPEDPNHILLELDLARDGTSSVYKADVRSGRRRVVQTGLTGIQRWYTDQNSEVRLGFGYKMHERAAKLKDGKGHWIDLTDTDWYETYSVEGFTNDPDIIFVSGPTSFGTDGLFKLNLQSGEIVGTVFEHEAVDMDYILHHPITGQLSGVAYTDDLHRALFYDADQKLVQKSLEHVLPGKNVWVTSRAYGRQLYLVQVSAAGDPGEYYIYDRDIQRMDPLAPKYMILSRVQQAQPGTLPAPQAHKIPVRDGSTIPGYLTIPTQHTGSPLPAIVLTHGGPRARDNAEWDYWAQFYASRGYLVLQPNFRGSTGYGRAFLAAGKKQWGGLMQDDVTDATKWLISEGFADPDRICIVGASYGGYAALMGTIKEQNLYRCAISVNGVTDLPDLKKSDRKFIGGRIWAKDMGLDGTDDKDVSPYHRADEVSAPILLMASKDDARVPYKQSRAMHKKLNKLKKESAYIEIEEGGHSFATSAARLKMLTETEKFLRKHLGGQ